MNRRTIFTLPLALTVFTSPLFAQRMGEKAGNEFLQYCGSADHNNFRPIEDKIICPKVLWAVPGAYGFPAVLDGVVYIGGKRIFKIDLDTGKVLASIPNSEEEEEQPADGKIRPVRIRYDGTPIIANKAVIVVRPTQVVEAYDLDLEERLWELELPDEGWGWWGGGSPALDDGVMVLVSRKGLAIDPLTGKILWISKALQGGVRMSPAIWKGRVIFGTDRGSLYALDLKTGATIWKRDYDTKFLHTDPVVVNGRIFLADRKGGVNAFDVTSGEHMWRKIFGASGCSKPGIGEGFLVAGFRKTVVAFAQDDGEMSKVMSFATGSNPFGDPTIVGQHLIVGDLAGYMYVVDIKSGDLKWRFTPRTAEEWEKAQVLNLAYLEKGIILVGTTCGLLALGNDNSKGPCPPGFLLTYER